MTPEAESLFNDMVDAHLAAGPGRRTFLHLRTSQNESLRFRGPPELFPHRLVDPGALRDLVGFGLLRRVSTQQHGATFEIGGAGVRFHAWLRQARGQPVDTVDESVRRLVDGAEFAMKHGSAAAHLQEGTALLWSDRTNTVTIRELGVHLRSALIDVTLDVTGGPVANPEQVGTQLRASLGTRLTTDREIEALVALAEAAQHLNQRLAHTTDDASKGAPPVRHEEMRRATFLTALCCFELSRLL